MYIKYQKVLGNSACCLKQDVIINNKQYDIYPVLIIF